jgi:hypothetical protein
MADVDPLPMHPTPSHPTRIQRVRDPWVTVIIAGVVLFAIFGIPILIWASSPPSTSSAHAIVVVRSGDGSKVSVGLPWLPGRSSDLNYSVVNGSADSWFREHAGGWFLASVVDDLGPSRQNRSLNGHATVEGNLLVLETNDTIAVAFEWTWRGTKDTIPFGRFREFEPSLPLSINGPPEHIEVALAGVEWSLGPLGINGRGAFSITDGDGDFPTGYIPLSGFGRAFSGVVEAVPPSGGSFIPLRWGYFDTAND